jgi:hypothetical protein
MHQIDSYRFSLSDLSGPLDQDLTVEIQSERGKADLARVPTRVAGDACSGRAPTAFWCFLVDGDDMTVFSATRQPRVLDRECRSRPEEGEKGG